MRCEECNNKTVPPPCKVIGKNGTYKCPFDLGVPCSHEYEYQLIYDHSYLPFKVYRKICVKCGDIEK